MSDAPRSAPRFVPTLTTVLDEAAVPLQRAPVTGVPVSGRPVPATTPGPGSGAAPAPAPPESFVALTPTDLARQERAFELEEDLLHRVLQRVDLTLEARLTDAVSAAVQRHLDSMLPSLRAEMERVLRAVVVQALAQELTDPAAVTTGKPADNLR